MKKTLTAALFLLLALCLVIASAETDGLEVGVGEICYAPYLAAYPEAEGYVYASDNTDVALVNHDGRVKGVSIGQCFISVSKDESFVGGFTLIVKAAPTSLSLAGNPSELGLGEERTFVFEMPEGCCGSVTWGVNGSGVIKVDEMGHVTSLSRGQATLYVRAYNGAYAELKITVAKAPTSLTLSPAEGRLAVGKSGTYKVKAGSGESAGCDFYVSDPTIASVDAMGKITALSAGTVTVTAQSYNGLTASASLTVLPLPEAVSIKADCVKMGPGQYFTAECVFEPADATDDVVFSTDNPDVFNVSAEGKVIARRRGSGNIIATTANGLSASLYIEVMDRPTRVRLTSPYNPVGLGETLNLIPVFPEGEYGSCTYTSSNSKIISVNADGSITANAKGKATITCKVYNGLTASLTISVGDPPTGVVISDKSITVGAQASCTLGAQITGGNGGAVFESLNPDIAIVTSDGVVTGVSAGTATIIAKTANGFTDDCTVTVIEAPQSVYAVIDRDVLGAGENAQLTAEIYPEYALGDVTFEVSDTSVLKADETGRITALKSGTAYVKCLAYNGVYAEICVSVYDAPKDADILLSCDAHPVEGTEIDFCLEMSAECAGALTISVSDESIVKFEDGRLYAVSAGNAVLTATAYNGAKASVDIQVAVKPEYISFDKAEYSIKTGEYLAFSVSPNPGAYVEYTTQSLSSDLLLYIEGRGYLAISAGDTVISAQTQDGLYAEAPVHIEAGDGDVIIDLTGQNLSQSEYLDFKARYPGVKLNWTAKYFGKIVSTLDTKLDLSGSTSIASFDEIREFLNVFDNIEYIDLSFTKFSYADLAAFREEMRDKCKIVWTVEIYRWQIRTDQTAFSTLLDDNSIHHSSQEFEPLKYCEDMLALDLGHNAIKDLSFLLGMPKLKILILAVNNLTDITLLGELTELEYLELFTNTITDATPLAKLTKLIDLNLSNNKVTDITPLLELPNLERLWMTHNGVSMEDRQRLMDAHPDAEMNFDAPGPDRRGWRSHHRYFVIYQIFHTNEWIPWDSEVPVVANYMAYY